MKDRLWEGHVFKKLNQKGKVLIEYAPLEKAWVPINPAGTLIHKLLDAKLIVHVKGKGNGKYKFKTL